MTAPWLDDGDIALYHGDALSVLRSLPEGIAQTCVTSPPYWGLRDYGNDRSVWGGVVDCDHEWGEHRRRVNNRHAHALREGLDGGDGIGGLGKDKNNGNPADWDVETHYCELCGAWRGCLGLEPTPDQYVANIVAVMREVWRVLRADGTLWLNLGSSYAGSGPSGASYESETTKRRAAGNGQDGAFRVSPTLADRGLTYRDKKPHDIPNGYKPKDMVPIPWLVAMALQADGWYLRSDIIWSKPNPMPESVSDRPTKAHEYVFLLAKQPRYYYDADAIREAHTDPTRHAGDPAMRPNNGDGSAGLAVTGVYGRMGNHEAGRNARSVWEIPTQATPEAHFATYPEALVRRCILAGSAPGDCVLDPFVGSGTTALVARKHGRRAIGIDLSEEYLRVAARRTAQLSLLGGAA